MLEHLIKEAEMRDAHTLWLGASKMGRPVYERSGFQNMKGCMEMNIDSGLEDRKETEIFTQEDKSCN